MNEFGNRECELKLKIRSQDILKNISQKMTYLGYKLINERIETDYIPDTKNFSCRKNNLLFRIRNISSSKINDVLFTLKVKQLSASFQDNIEIETYASHINLEHINLILTKVKDVTGIEIPSLISNSMYLRDIIKLLYDIGFIECTLIQKKRVEYMGELSKISFDSFPKPVGIYLEIEANNEKSLFETVQLLELNDQELEKRNYGQIIREATKGSNVCVFDDVLFIEPDSNTPTYLHDLINGDDCH